jgi:hypothetical protein
MKHQGKCRDIVFEVQWEEGKQARDGTPIHWHAIDP